MLKLYKLELKRKILYTMKPLFNFELLTFRITCILLFIITFFLPANIAIYNFTSSKKAFGYPIAYLCFPKNEITSSLFNSVGINILALCLDFIIIYIIVKKSLDLFKFLFLR